MDDFNQHQDDSIDDEPVRITDLAPQKTFPATFIARTVSNMYLHTRDRRVRWMLIGLLFLILICLVLPQFFNPLLPYTQRTVPGKKASSSVISTPSPPDLLALQRRPLHLPTVKAGERCPTTQEQKAVPNVGVVQGKEPVYTTIGAEAIVSPAILYYADAQHFANGINNQGWGGQEALWFLNPQYRGFILIRGHQLDGPHLILFGQPPIQQLIIDQTGSTGTTSWTSFGSYTRLQTPGCYAYQVDGANFSTIIIFQATVRN